MTAYSNELMASRKCMGEERKVVCIGDSGQKGTDVYWCAPLDQWICITLDQEPRLRTAKEIALVRMDEDADPEAGLTQRGLACDFEREEALWIVDAAELESLASHGDAIKVVWSSTKPGRVPFTDAVLRRDQRLVQGKRTDR
jgi:hypothetical protein